MADPFRRAMVEALASYLNISKDRASNALEHVFEATEDIRGEYAYGPSSDPDPANPGVQLAWRVEQAIYAADIGPADMECAVIVVQDAMTRVIGAAALGIPAEDVELFLRLGIGAWRRGLRQGG